VTGTRLNIYSRAMSTTPPKPQQRLHPKMAFALMLETACEQFEVLQLIRRDEIRIVSDYSPGDVRAKTKYLRAPPGCIQAALAKSFVANVIRARRICEHGASALQIDRIERRLFLHTTDALLRVRDVNEHGFDVKGDESSRSALHFHEHGGHVDETGLFIADAETILMGPLNLFDIYRCVARMRGLAGFATITPEVLRPRPTAGKGQG